MKHQGVPRMVPKGAIDRCGGLGPLSLVGEVHNQTSFRGIVGRIKRQRQPHVAFEFLHLRRPRETEKRELLPFEPCPGCISRREVRIERDGLLGVFKPLHVRLP